MAVTGVLYGKVHKALWNKEIDWDEAGKIKVSLHTASYTPSQSHDYYDDVTHEVSGTGYTTGGQALTSTSSAYVDDSAATAWAAGTAYSLGDLVRPSTANGYLYLCVAAGTAHASTEPTWSTVLGRETTDGTVAWLNVGYGYVNLDAANPAWTTSTIANVRYAIFRYDSGAAATSPLIGYWDLGASYSTTNGTLELMIPAAGLFHLFSLN